MTFAAFFLQLCVLATSRFLCLGLCFEPLGTFCNPRERKGDRETEREIDKKRMTKKEIKMLGGHIDHIDIQG